MAEQQSKASKVLSFATKHPVKFGGAMLRATAEGIKNPTGRKTYREKTDVEYTSSALMYDKNGEAYYRITMEEQQGKDSPWWKKALERDYSIGASAGGLLAMAGLGLTGASVPAIAFIAIGGVIGATSDYFRNQNELENGVDIKKPQFLNRDMVKSAMLTGLGVLIGTSLLLTGAAALGATGAGLPLIGGAITAASNALATGSGIGGFLGAVNAARVGLISAPVLATALYSVGAAIGGIRGAEAGYKRMEQQYERAEVKHQHPQLRVLAKSDFAQNKDQTLAETIIPVAAAAITSTSPSMQYAPELMEATQNMAQNIPEYSVASTNNVGSWAERVGSRAGNTQSFVEAYEAEHAALGERSV